MKLILGGGIGGLAAGYYLRRKFPHHAIKLYESSHEIGGWIKSRKLPDGTIFEQGPRTLRPKGEAGYNTLQLIDELDLSDKIKPIKSSHPAAKIRMIYVNGELHVLPSSFMEIFRKFSPFSKPMFSFLMNDLIADRKDIKDNDESIYNFVERRFGTEIAQYAISPMICGICAGDAKQISVKFLMKSIFEREQKYGGVIKGSLIDIFQNGIPDAPKISSTLANVAKEEKWSVYSFNGGMEIFPLTLKQKLIDINVDIQLNKICTKLEFLENSVKVSMKYASKAEEVEHIVSSLPAHSLADLVQTQHPELAQNLKKIPSVDVAVVNLQFKNSLGMKEAFGFLVPPSENLPILGVIFDSCCFPNNDATILTVMMGGHWFQELFGKEPKEEYLLDTALQQVSKALNIKVTPDNYKVSILRKCIPQYVVGHSEVIKNIEDYIKNHKLPLSICGSSYYGVGVNDVIFSSKNAVDKI